MVERETQDRIRRLQLGWATVTLLFFGIAWLIVEYVAQTLVPSLLGTLVIAVAYIVSAFGFVRQILRANNTPSPQLLAREAELAHRLREATLLHRVIATATSTLESDKILTTICEELARAFDLPQAGVALLSADGTHETVVAEYRAADRPSALGIIIPIQGNQATQTVIQTRAPLVLENAQTDPRQTPMHSLEKQRGTMSLLIVPLIVRDRVIGTLGLESITLRQFTADEIALAQNVAIAVSQALESARLTTELRQELAERKHAEDDLRRRNAELDALNVTTLGLINRRDPDELLESIMARAAALMNTSHGFLFETSPETDTLRIRVGIGRFAEHLGFELKRGNGAAGIVWQTGKPMAIENYPVWEHHTASFEWLCSIICVPLRSNQDIVGVIGVAYLEPDRKIDLESIELLDRFGRLASLALENAHLYTAAQNELAERRNTQAHLQATLADIERAQTKARSILDAATDSMLLVTPAQRIVSVNWSFCRNFFGMHPREVVGHTLADYQNEFERLFESPAELRKIVQETAADTEQSFTSIIVQTAPRRRELQLVSTPVRTGTNEHLGRLFVFHDVTQEREVDRLKNEFVSMVSHELRSPLTSIKGYVDLLQTGAFGKITPEQDEFLGIIKNNTDRLVDLINDLLDISRIEAGRVELRSESVDLGLILRQVVNTFRPQTVAKNQSVILNLTGNPPPVWADRDRLIQIVTNLVSNAHKYTPPGGTITLSASAVDNHVRVDVQDNGVGISQADQTQLFTKFFRSKDIQSNQIPGTGLGLTITRSLVEMHGGRLSVSSTPGQGATFSFILPIRPVVEHVAASTGKRVLIVDEDREFVTSMWTMLERAGYQVLVASGAREALRLAREQQPDLITLDLLLPEVDGFAALESLRRDPQTRVIPILILSILAEREEGKLLGAADYLSKPITEQSLLRHVARILEINFSNSILIAQADEISRQRVTALLGRAGYDTRQAHDGNDALAQIQEQIPGVAFLDLKMPGMDAVQVLQVLRSDERTRRLPVVVMSGVEGITDKQRALIAKLSAPTILTKPVTTQKLATAIYQAVYFNYS